MTRRAPIGAVDTLSGTARIRDSASIHVRDSAVNGLDPAADRALSSPLPETSTGLSSVPVPLEATTGGAPELVLLVFLSLFVATTLSLYLAYRLYRGYRDSGHGAMLVLGIGLVLLTTTPLLLRLVLSNVSGVDPAWREVVATAAQLCGLLLILGVIYGRR